MDALDAFSEPVLGAEQVTFYPDLELGLGVGVDEEEEEEAMEV
jgi:hypothetical protein